MSSQHHAMDTHLESESLHRLREIAATYRWPQLMIVLGFIGLAVAFYDSYAIYTGQLLWCPPPIDGCNEVAASPYARIFGLPIGYYGVVYYAYMIGLAALLAIEPRAKGVQFAALLYTAVGVLFSAYFLVLQITLIHAFCIYCLVSAIMTVLLFASAVLHGWSQRHAERRG